MSLDEDRETVEALTFYSENLSSWELDFVISIQERVQEGRELTEGQRAKAEEIYERVSRGSGRR